MAVRYQRPISHAATWSRRLGFFAVLLFVLSAVAHRAGTMEPANFIAVALLAAALAALGTCLSVAGFASLWMFGARGGRAAFWGLLSALVLLVPAGVAAVRYLTLPPLNDVATDTRDIPGFLVPPPAAATWLDRTVPAEPPGPDAQRLAYPEMTGRRYEGAIDRVLQGVETVAAARGVVFTEAEGANLVPEEEAPAAPLPDTPEVSGDTAPPVPDLATLTAPVPVPRPESEPVPAPPASRVVLQGETATTPFAFRSDVVVRLIEEEETTFVDMRAASRHGGHDLGLNAALINGFLRALDAELLGIAEQ